MITICILINVNNLTNTNFNVSFILHRIFMNMEVRLEIGELDSQEGFFFYYYFYYLMYMKIGLFIILRYLTVTRPHSTHILEILYLSLYCIVFYQYKYHYQNIK